MVGLTAQTVAIRTWRRARHARNGDAVLVHKLRVAVVIEPDRVAPLMQQPVVAAAEQDQVRQVGSAAEGPVLDVVSLDEPRAVAPREAAALVAGLECPSQ